MTGINTDKFIKDKQALLREISYFSVEYNISIETIISLIKEEYE